MKKILFSFSLLLFWLAVQAQEQGSSFQKSIAIKWNPTSLYFGKVALQGEYNFKKKKSITFDIGIPYNKTITRNIDNEDKSITLKTFSVMGGYRMYLGKKTMTGVYFEPYLKYLKNDASTSFLGGSTVKKLYALTSDYSAVGVGAQLGVQFMIAKRLTFDFFFLGPEANLTNHRATLQDLSTVGPWSQQDATDAQKEINDNLKNIPIVGRKVNVTVNEQNKTVSSDYSGFLPGIRFGLSVGWRF